MTEKTLGITDHNEVIDGRMQRSNKSREKVVKAFLELINSGRFTPSAEEVAKKANVGLRTVFRRFNEMELLYRELVVETEKWFTPAIFEPLKSDKWEEQLQEVFERKVSIYERMMPYILAMLVYQYQSAFMKEKLNLWTNLEKKVLEKVLPFSQTEFPQLFAAMEVTLSYNTWNHLRNDQKLSINEAQESMLQMKKMIIKEWLIQNKK